jgi:oligosaccharide repeat unit polymerase
MFIFAKNLIFKFLITLFSISVFGGVITNQPIPIFDISSNFNSIFVCVVLFFLFIPFNYKENKNISSQSNFGYSVNDWYLFILIALSCLALFINIYILYRSAAYLIASSLTVGDYKNLGYAEDFIKSLVNPVFGFLSSLLSPLSYICLSIHFYSIIKMKKGYALMSLIGALNIAVVPLFYFARGGILTFCLLYICMALLVFQFLSRRHKKQIIKGVSLFIMPVFFVFIFISLNRFDFYPHYREGTLVTNHILFSIFDYLSQWMVNGDAIINNFTHDKIIFASNFLYIPNKVFSLIGVGSSSLQELREYAFPGYENYFNGPVALLVYDFGYIGALAVCIFYFFIAKRAVQGKSKRVLSLLTSYVILLPIPIYFFQGLFTVFGFYNQAIIYSLIFIFIQRLRWKS